ncbi:conserved hypothetical protein [Candidatus Koribacter versatilis Ellin345]|uniref:DUF4126 domain-containing protein n=1 Tax=Koribacter versatilis (strain Ellin345) TaxID=204669 RepID=Q1IHL5_KORVE|nr:DUF4126 family protein [Candidatus Koribacter versatilis]ABF43635.1 conserved hypothetical protein [Candidatus Koribacter versatilis Ellin345]
MRTSSIVGAAFLGIATGLRSITGLAALSQAARRQLVEVPFAWLGSEKVAEGLAIAAGAEYLGDKLPFVPARTETGPLAGRMLFGALCGALVAEPESRAAAMVAGVIGAAGAAFAGFHMRRRITQDGAMDLPVALAEDAIAITFAAAGIAVASFRRDRQRRPLRAS